MDDLSQRTCAKLYYSGDTVFVCVKTYDEVIKGFKVNDLGGVISIVAIA